MDWLAPLAWLLVSCTPSLPPRPAEFADPGLETTGATPSFHLWQLPPRLQLAPPLDTELPDRTWIPLTIKQDTEAKHHPSMRIWRDILPFEIGDEARRFAPAGMELEVDGQIVPWSTGGLGSATRPAWRINKRVLLLAWPGEAPPTSVRVTWRTLDQVLQRHRPKLSGLSPEEFVRYQVTLNDRTRPGLMLPAPTTAEWTLVVPPGGQFDTWLALEPAPVVTNQSDGAEVVLSLVDGAKTQVLGRRRLAGPSTDFEHWRVSLSAYGGREVTLKVETLPLGNRDYDYVFLGAPAVFGQPKSDAEVRRVVVIGLDTTRPDAFSELGYERKTTPEFDEVIRQSARFSQAWTSAPRTRPSFRAATTGRNPLDAVGSKNIAEVFSENGFATAAYVANIHLQPRFDFHKGFDDWHFRGTSRADEQVDSALAFFERYQDRDTYLFLHIMDPHIFYKAPGSYRDKWVTDPDPTLPEVFNRWDVYAWDKKGELSDRRRKHIRDLYDGEMSYMSVELRRFFDELDQMGGRTLVIVHNDHGEEFWEHGGFEHNHNLYDQTTRALLLVRSRIGMARAEPLVLDAPATLQDIAPTLFDYAGFQNLPPLDGRSLRPAIEGKGWGQERAIGVAHLRYGHDRWGVVVEGKKYILHTGTGQEELYDLVADPEEKLDLAAKLTDRSPWYRAMAEAHKVDIGPGWRLKGDYLSVDRTPMVFQLPHPALSAGVIDPELTIENPRNEEWGEPPRRTPAEVGVVTLAEDKRTLIWAPGSNPRDLTLYVRFDPEVPISPEGLLARQGDNELRFLRSPAGVWEWRQGTNHLQVLPGSVLVPPMSEAERMRSAQVQGTADDMAALEALGYVGEAGAADKGSDSRGGPDGEEGEPH